MNGMQDPFWPSSSISFPSFEQCRGLVCVLPYLLTLSFADNTMYLILFDW